MRFLLDANLSEDLVEELIQNFSIDVCRDRGARSDEEIYQYSKEEGRVLLTLDTDFLNILKYPPQGHPGIVVFKVLPQSYFKIRDRIFKFLKNYLGRFKDLRESTIVVKEDKVRIYRGFV